jgi:Tfp pilus assembly protein PilV
MNTTTKNNHGFTLIEAVISLGVLSIGILALFAMQTLSIRGNANASRITTQATWGSDEIEKMLTAKYAAVFTKNAVDVSDDNKYTVTRTVTADTPVKNIKTVDVVVTNVTDGKQVTLRYLKANESAF